MSMKKWTKEEEEQLKSLYSYTSTKELMQVFHRSAPSIFHKGIRLKVRRYYSDFSSKLTRGEATEFEIGWITGLFEGEGSVGFSCGSKCPHPILRIANTNLDILKKAQTIIGGSIYNKPEDGINHKDCYDLCLHGSRALFNTLRMLLPNLIVKEAVTVLMLEFCESRLSNYRFAPISEKQRNLYLQVKKVNTKGKVMI